jgi:hypothetical protein
VGLTAALVDRARTLTNRPTPYKVRGTTQMAATQGAWFRARLELPAAAETAEDGAGGKRRSLRAPRLLYGVRDSAGGDVVVTPEDRLEVDSAALGRAQWEVAAYPKPMRRKRRVIGWSVALKRVEETLFPPPLGTVAPTGAGLDAPYWVAQSPYPGASLAMPYEVG